MDISIRDKSNYLKGLLNSCQKGQSISRTREKNNQELC